MKKYSKKMTYVLGMVMVTMLSMVASDVISKEIDWEDEEYELMECPDGYTINLDHGYAACVRMDEMNYNDGYVCVLRNKRGKVLFACKKQLGANKCKASHPMFGSIECFDAVEVPVK
jgi:hypothetical protein